MKKIILMFVAASLSLATFAQRNCDLKVTMLSPAAATTITKGVNFASTLKITNLGPDSLMVADTMLTALALDATVIGGTTLVLIFNKPLAVDSSITIPYNPFSLNFTSAANGSHNYCGLVDLAMPATIAVDAVTTNNAGCNQVTLAGGSTGIGSLNNILASDINSYPNPASDKLNFEMVVEKEGSFTFEIFDINGKLVKSNNQTLTNGNQTIALDLNGLSKGAYSCKISSEEYSVISKFIIQ